MLAAASAIQRHLRAPPDVGDSGLLGACYGRDGHAVRRIPSACRDGDDSTEMWWPLSLCAASAPVTHGIPVLSPRDLVRSTKERRIQGPTRRGGVPCQ